MASPNELCRMDAVTLARQIRKKSVSPREVINAVLARMEKLEPILHAFCTPTPDLARKQADRIEKAIMAGEEVGPLAGVPIGIKDLVCTAGIRTVSGSIAYKEFVPEEDDIVVERLKNAGAIILGKTNVPEFGYSGVGHNPVFETTRNPWNTERTTGGSSAGSGPDARDRHTLPKPDFDWTACAQGDVKGLRVAYSPDWGYAAVDSEVRQVVDAAVKVFEKDLGCRVEEAHPGWEDPYQAFWGLVALEADLRGLRRLGDKYGAQMTPHFVDFVRRPWAAEEMTHAVIK